jgi:uncharacterized protein YraI
MREQSARATETKGCTSGSERTTSVIVGHGLWRSGRYISSKFGAMRVLNFTSATTPTISRRSKSRELARCLPIVS